MRATRPSIPSSTAPAMIATAAFSNCPVYVFAIE
jgi:hypothetical protein